MTNMDLRREADCGGLLQFPSHHPVIDLIMYNLYMKGVDAEADLSGELLQTDHGILCRPSRYGCFLGSFREAARSCSGHVSMSRAMDN